MPYVQLIGPFGDSPVICTVDHELLRLWFAEWLPRLYPASLPDDETGPIGPRIVVHPLEVHPGRGDWDWLTDTRYHGQWISIPRDPQGALDVMAQIRENPPPL